MEKLTTPGTVILRHKPGLQAKRIVDVNPFAVAGDNATIQPMADEPEDPLLANYRLVTLNSIVTTFKSNDNGKEQLIIQPFSATYNEQFGLEPQKNQHINPLKINTGDGEDEMIVTGDFNGDGKDEIALVFIDTQSILCVEVYTFDDKSTYSSVASVKVGNAEKGSVKALRLVNEKDDSLCLTWSVKKDHQYQVIGACLRKEMLTDGTSSLKLQTLIELPGPEPFAVSCGIFTGKMNNELALVYWSKHNNIASLHYKLYQPVSGNEFTEIHTGIIKKGKAGKVPAILELVTGSFLKAENREGLIVCCDGLDQGLVLYAGLFDTVKNQFVSYETNLQAETDLLKLSAGDLNNDGVEELVVAYRCNGAAESYIRLAIYNFTNSMIPQKTAAASICGSDHTAFAAIDLKIGISQLKYEAETDDGNQLMSSAAIVLAGLGYESIVLASNGYLKMSVGLLQVTPDGKLPYYLDADYPVPLKNCFSEDIAYSSNDIWGERLGLGMGDFTGETIRVGPPKRTVHTKVNSVLAIVKAPPVLDGANISASISFHTVEGANAMFYMTAQNAYTYSDQLSKSLGIGILGSITQSITKSYGENFSEGQLKNLYLAIDLNISSYGTDFIIFSEVAYTVWEYPVYYKDKQKKGCLLVIFPQAGLKTSLQLSTSKRSFFKSNSLNGNILSYLPEYNGLNFSHQRLEVGGGLSSSLTISLSDTHGKSGSYTSEQGTQIQNKQALGLKIPVDFLNGIDIGIEHSSDQTYTKNKSYNLMLSMNQSTTINISYNNTNIPSAQNYIVSPILYFDKDFGYLMIDYSTAVAASGSWYEKEYRNDTMFYKLWAAENNNKDTDNKSNILNEDEHRTRDIDFAPNTADKNLTDILVTVHNTTLFQSGKVSVQLYKRQPLKGNEIGVLQTANPIAARSSSTLIFSGLNLKQWLSNETGTLEVYAVIMPETNLPGKEDAFKDPECKIGFATFPPKILNKVRF